MDYSITKSSEEMENAIVEEEAVVISPVSQHVIAPVAPTPSRPFSPALAGAQRTLDELVQQGLVSTSRADWLREKCLNIIYQLNRSKSNQLDIWHKVKDYTVQLEQMKNILQQAERLTEKSHDDINQVRAKRVDCLRLRNMAACAEERCARQDQMMDILEKEKNRLETEHTRQKVAAAKDWERESDKLHMRCAHLSKEVANRKVKVEGLHEQLNQQLRMLEESAASMEGLAVEHESVMDQLKHVSSQPGIIQKDIMRLTRQKAQVDHALNQCSTRVEGLVTSHDSAVCCLRELEADVNVTKAITVNAKAVSEERTRDIQSIAKKRAMCDEQMAVLTAERVEVDIKLKTKEQELAACASHKQREERVRELLDKQLLKADHDLDVSLKVKDEQLLRVAALKQEVSAACVELERLAKERENLEQDAERMQKASLHQGMFDAEERASVERLIKEQIRLRREKTDRKKALDELQLRVLQLSKEKDQRSVDLKKTELRLDFILADGSLKLGSVDEFEKICQVTDHKVKAICKLQYVVKCEKNRKMELTFVMRQKMAELEEKTKILQNEVDTLRVKCRCLDRDTQREHTKLVYAQTAWQRMHNEVRHVAKQEEATRALMNKWVSHVTSLTNRVDAAESDLLVQKKRYERLVQQCNDRGLQLCERNEEAGILYEEINFLEELLREGECRGHEQETELSLLHTLACNEMACVETFRRQVCAMEHLDIDYEMLLSQLTEASYRRQQLETVVENPECEGRTRLVGLQPMSPRSLDVKITALKDKIKVKEADLKERLLVLQQITAFNVQLSATVKQQDVATAASAHQIRDIKWQIKKTTRALMSIVAQLALTRTEALTLGSRVRSGEEELLLAAERLARGEAPTDGIAAEWLKEEERERLWHDMCLHGTRQDAGDACGLMTTAEPRPNFYLPINCAELPVPKPYGAFAPFKPSSPRAVSRHMRHPTQRNIDI